MHFPSSQTILTSLSCAVIVSMSAACRSKQLRPEALNSSSNVSARKCLEWEQAQASSGGLGWDLVYESTLRRNNFGPDAPMWKWIHEDGPRPPVNKLVAEWQGEPIISSILVEVVGPEGSPGGFWYIRTMNHLYRWSFNRGKFHAEKDEFTNPADFDKAFEEMKCWEQAAPVKTDSMFDGYYGFISFYREGKSRQMLLTFRDFFLVDPRPESEEKNLEDPVNWGRVWKALAPVVESSTERK